MTPKIVSLVVVCPHCEHKYTLGVDGTVDGCDACMNVIRNAVSNTIIDMYDREPSDEELAAIGVVNHG